MEKDLEEWKKVVPLRCYKFPWILISEYIIKINNSRREGVAI
nr:MAG TPA: hypothetical protein [Caudoviricetes sp.]